MAREHNEKEDLKHRDLSPEVLDVIANPVNGEMLDWDNITSEDQELSRESTMFDIDRMVNEGLGGGQVTEHNGLIDSSTTDTMVTVDETPGNTMKSEENG